jgi:hypothetical protein
MLGIGAVKAQETYVESIKPYNAALAGLCPEKHLENLSSGDFNQIIEDYLGGLSSVEQSRWGQAAQPMCAESMVGISCANIAYVRAATKLRKMDELAGAACHSGYICSTEFAECRK